MPNESMLNLLRSFRRPSRPSRRRRAAVMFGEALECRTMLAGNVAATLADGNLFLNGDRADNSVEVAVENEDVIVRGLDGTTINGASNDFVVVSGDTTIDGNVRILLGGGTDTFRITGPLTVSGNVRLTDVRGSNQLGITDATIDGTVDINFGAGGDTVSLLGTTIGSDLRLNMGRGKNLVSLFDSTVTGETHVRTGRGHDRIVLDGMMTGHVDLRTASGTDRIVITGSVIDGSLHAATRRGRDFVQIDDSSVSGDTKFWMGGDSDLVVTQGTVEFGGTFVAGGILGRRDTIELSDETTIAGKERIILFEHKSLSNLTGVNQWVSDIRDAALDAQIRLNGVDIGDLTLTVDTSGNSDVVESNNTLVTNSDTFLIEGTTLPRATVDVTAGPNGSIGLGSVEANDDGTYSILVDLLNGPTTVIVTTTDVLNRTLTEEFNLHKAVGTVVRFESSEGSFDVELFDEDAPQTVDNFLNYSERYEDSIVHRSAVTLSDDPFVIQGGGFALDASDDLQEIATDPPVMSEFTGAHSNVRGTIAMALSGGNPNSGTSQWFINLRDNSTLDSQQFTVFGEVIGDGMNVVDAIAALPRIDINDVVPNTNDALNEVPLDGYMLQQVQLTGTVSIAADSIEVVGTGTMFTTDLEINDIIEIEDEQYRVISISSDTSLFVDFSQSEPITDADFFTEPIATTVPTRQQYVVFNSIGAIL